MIAFSKFAVFVENWIFDAQFVISAAAVAAAAASMHFRGEGSLFICASRSLARSLASSRNFVRVRGQPVPLLQLQVGRVRCRRLRLPLYARLASPRREPESRDDNLLVITVGSQRERGKSLSWWAHTRPSSRPSFGGE